MERSLLGRVRRSFGAALTGLGCILIIISLLASPPILMEGVTHRSGEGAIDMPESPAQVHWRLTVLAWLVGGAVFGWLLGHVGYWYLRSAGPFPGLLQLAAELLLLLGVFGLGCGLLVAYGHQLAAYDVDAAYDRLAIRAAIAGALFLGLGLVLLLLAVRRERSSTRGANPIP